MISSGRKAARHGSGRMAPIPIDITSRAAALLGGPKVLQVTRLDPFDWISAIRRGFPSLVLDSFAANLGATNSELGEIIGLSARALAGRKRKNYLSPHESERLLRAAKTVARAEDVLGDLANGFAWLKTPNISLGGVTPVSLIDTEIGSELVADVLGRIEHGIFA